MKSHEPFDLAGKVIGCAMEVHQTLGAGFLETVYETALAIELNDQKIPHEKQKELIVKYKGQIAGTYRADLFIDNQLIIEIKSTQNLVAAHEAQLVNYLTAPPTSETPPPNQIILKNSVNSV